MSPSALSTSTAIVETAPTASGEKKSKVPWIIPTPPTFHDKYEERKYLKGRLAVAFRIFAKLGFEEGIAGHVTLRDPVEPNSFWVNPFGVPWRRLKASDLIRVNHEGVVVDGGPVRLLNTGAYMIHHAVHAARPDVICVAHSHTIYGRAFSSLGRTLDIINQDSCVFYNDQVVQSSFTGAAMEEAPGVAIARSLGSKKLAILQNHGLLTVGHTVESAVFWFISAEKCCQVQLLADAAVAGRGEDTLKVEHKDAQHSYDTVGNESVGWFSGIPAFLTMIDEGGDDYLE